MVGSKNESSTLLKIEQNCSFDSKKYSLSKMGQG